MVEISNNELQKIKGGGVGWGVAIVAGIVFIIGVIDGHIALK